MKIAVIDAVNRIGAPEFDSRALIAGAVPSARYVRAFIALVKQNGGNRRLALRIVRED